MLQPRSRKEILHKNGVLQQHRLNGVLENEHYGLIELPCDEIGNVYPNTPVNSPPGFATSIEDRLQGLVEGYPGDLIPSCGPPCTR